MIRLLQFSDTHLYADVGRTFRVGIDPERTLASLIDAVLNGEWRADCALVTGDLVHDGSAAGYERLRSYFARLGIPVYCLPGNHDDTENMRAILAEGAVRIEPLLQCGAWQIVLLDSTVEGEAGGWLAETELERLDASLSAEPDRPALVVLHHPPLPCGSRWMDEAMLLDNPEALFAVTDRHPHVRAITWGHIHQAFNVVRRGVRCLAAPSTMVQFTRDSETFAIDDTPPACRWFELQDDGEFTTGIWPADATGPQPEPAEAFRGMASTRDGD